MEEAIKLVSPGDSHMRSAPDKAEVRIPDARLAREAGTPFVLDLQRRTLVSTPSQAELHTEAIHAYVSRSGKGDLAWDGSLVALRNAIVRLREQNQAKQVNLRTNPWDLSVELPGDMNLPCRLMVVTKEQSHYLVTIHKITADGITVTSEKLSADAAKGYADPVEATHAH